MSGWRSKVRNSQQRDIRLVAIAAALTAIVYLWGGFVWDDLTLIDQTLSPLDFRGLLSLWVGPVTPDGPGSAYYRPLSMTILAILGRLGPMPIHLFTLALHVLSAAVLVRLCGGNRWPLVAGLVFAVHPVASEVLGWCSALPDALAAALGLVATLYAKERRGGAIYLLFLAGLAKETGLLVPLAFGLAGQLPRGWWRGWAGVVALVAILRLALGVQVGNTWIERLGQAPEAVGWSLGTLVWPVPLTAVRDLWTVPSGATWVGLSVLLLLIAKGWGNRMALAGAGLVLAGPLIALPVVLDGHLAAERYLYPSLIGLSMWASACLSAPRPRWMTVLPVAAAISVHVVRAPAWKDNVSLFSAAVSATPDSSYAWHFLGISYAEEGQMASAAGAFEQAVLAGHPHPEDRLLRLRTLVESGRGAEAMRWVQSGPKEELTADYIAWWARASFMTGDLQQAKHLLGKLNRKTHFDGPRWVSNFARTVYQKVQDDARLEDAAQDIESGM